MTIDVGKILRLAGAVEKAAKIETEYPVQTSSAVSERYKALRLEVARAVEDDAREEFDRLFPAELGGYGRNPNDMLEKFYAARTLLETLAGWLDGFIQEARMTIEAEAYARERVKRESVGFKGEG